MILDAENLFFDKTTIASSLTSDVIAMGVGESSEPMHLFVALDGEGSSSETTVTLKTSATAAFSSSVTLGEYTAPFAGFVPRGNLGFLRLDVTSDSGTGTITAGLVYDDDVK